MPYAYKYCTARWNNSARLQGMLPWPNYRASRSYSFEQLTQCYIADHAEMTYFLFEYATVVSHGRNLSVDGISTCDFRAAIATALSHGSIHHSVLKRGCRAGDDSILQGTNRHGTGLLFSIAGCAQEFLPYSRPWRTPSRQTGVDREILRPHHHHVVPVHKIAAFRGERVPPSWRAPRRPG
jgi:hypothetical protein